MFQKQASWKQKWNPVLLCYVSRYQCLNSDLIITNILNIENCEFWFFPVIVIKMFYKWFLK